MAVVAREEKEEKEEEVDNLLESGSVMLTSSSSSWSFVCWHFTTRVTVNSLSLVCGTNPST